MEETTEIKQRFEKDLQEAQGYMKPIHAGMDKSYEMYRNRWQEDEKSMRISDAYAYTETIVPILTNKRVRAMVKSEYPEEIEHAMGMEYILDYVFDCNHWDYEQQDIVRKAMIYRSGLAYTGYDEQANNGTGKITIIPINPRWTYLDPSATELEDSRYFIYVEPMRDTQVKKMYPDKADKIGKKDDDGSFGDKQKSWFKNLLNSVKGFVVGNNQNEMINHFDYNQLAEEMSEEQKYKNSVAFIHYWYRDDDDNWRVAYFADDVELEDTENPFWHGKLPYDIFSPTKDILSSLGIPMTEQIEDVSFEKNVLYKMFIENAKRTVEPPLIYNTTVNVKDPLALKERAWQDGIIPVANPDGFPLDTIATFAQMPQIPGWADSLPDRMQMQQDYITGVNDSFRGMSEATSGKEVQLKQEAAYTRIKTMVDNFELFTKKIAQKVVVNAMQYMDDDVYRVKGDYRQVEKTKGKAFDYEAIPSGENEEGETEYDTNEFFLYANPNEWSKAVEVEDGEQPSEEEVKEAERVLNFLVEIEAGSSLPTSRSAKREEALELYSAEVIDQKKVLEIFEYADAEEIMSRMGKMQEAQAQQEQAMQQQMMQQQAQQQGGAMMQPPQGPPGGMPPQGGMPQQPMQGQPQQPPQQDMQATIQQVKQQVPELANATDEQVLKFIQLMQQQGGQPQ